MSTKGKYRELWTKHKKSIKEALKKVADESSIQLSSKEFKDVGGKRLKSGYDFNLEFTNGEVSNFKNGEAVSRDLRDVLKESDEVMEILKSGHYKLKMDKEFCLWISRED